MAETLSGYPAANSTTDFFAPVGGEGNSLPPTFYENSARERGGFSGKSPELSVPFLSRPAVTAEGGYQKAEGYQNTALGSSGVWPPQGQERSVAESRPVDFLFPAASLGKPEVLPGMQELKAGFFSAMTFIGSLWNSYIILQASDKCYLLDQHAAHERVLFEDLKRRWLGSRAAQRLLLPVQIECTPGEEAQAQESLELLNSLGFEFESLGPHTLVLKTVPLLVDGLEVEPVFLETLADIASGGQGRESVVIDTMLARLACRMAVKANQPLTVSEIRSLLEKLDKTPLAHTCPHGRPFYFKLDRGEIDKRFQR